MIRKIGTKELLNLLKENNCKLADVRSADAYNGWQLKGEPRGGHISGAKSLPAKWLNYIDWIEIVKRKNFNTDEMIVVYGYSSVETEAAAERFLKSGFSKVFIYNNFLNEWSANPELPMQRLPRFSHLVSPEWVNNLITGKNPESYNNNRYVIVHAHYRNRDAYTSGHIPGAIDMDTLSLEAPETWNRRTPKELKETLEMHGIDAETTVIMYGKHMFPNHNDPFPGSAAGDIAAIRCAFIMLYAGVRDVRVLNGGYQSWTDAGFEVSAEDLPKTSVREFGLSIPARPDLAVDTPKAKEMLLDDNSDLVCVRSWPEYIGEVSGYNYIEAKGRIPGAVFADCGSDAYHMENYRNPDNTMREYHEIEDLWFRNGITSGKHLAFYCGTGWRGSEAWFNAWLMGWPNVSVYDGGWFEWSSDPANEFETGNPKQNMVINSRTM